MISDRLQLLIEAIETRTNEWGGEEKSALFKACEMGGEAGEVLNEVKKLERARIGMKGGKEGLSDLADEIGDVIVSTLILADHYGLDVVACAALKFNKTSAKHGFKTRVEV